MTADRKNFSVSCVIPAYNEAKNIAAVLRPLKKLKKAGQIQEIIVISDGSKDNTAQEAARAGADVILIIKKNRGKGGAIVEGLKQVKGEIILILDADLLNLSACHIQELLKPIKNQQAEMVIGQLAENGKLDILPQLSGQRALSRRVISEIISRERFFKRSGYRFEILLNREAKKMGLRKVVVPLVGLGHLRKEQKFPLPKALLYKLRNLFDLAGAYRHHITALWLIPVAVIIYLIFFSPIKIWGSLGRIPSPTHKDKILVIAAHPDDEIIGAGGYITDSVKQGAQVRIVIATNGDANKLAAIGINKKAILRQENFLVEGKERIAESKLALSYAGLPESNIYFLSFPDRELKELLAKNWQEVKTSKYTGLRQSVYDDAYRQNTAYNGSNFVSLLEEIITNFQPNIIITHHPKDYNSDHQAVYSFTQIALENLILREIISRPTEYSFLIHWKISEFPHPFRYQPTSGLFPPKDLTSDCNWLTYQLSPETEKKKEQEINSFKSQLKSPLLYLILKASIRTNELFCQGLQGKS